MPLKQIPKPTARKSELLFAVHPYLDASDELWDEGLHLFHCWLIDNFGVGQLHGDFEIAEKLNVHRLVSDAWLGAMVRTGRAQGVIARIGPRSDDAFEAPGFKVLPLPPGERKVNLHVLANGVQEFDPWTDRSHDDSLPDAQCADAFVDRFYLADTNEHFIFRRKPLILMSGHYFVPVAFKDLPRYADTPEAKELRAGGPPPINWRNRVEQAARGEKTVRRKRAG